MRGLLRESACAARALLRARGFTTAIVGTLALGLGVALTTFAVVNAYLLRSMPYAGADRLYHVAYSPPGSAEPEGMTGIDWAALSDVVEHADASAPTRVLTGEGAGLEELMGLSVDRGSVDLLGVRAAPGRSLMAGDFAAGAEPVVLLGHALWRGRFGGDAAVVGRLLWLRPASGGGAQAHRIVGVLPPDFRYAREHARGEVAFAVPLLQRGRSYMVRLRDGVPAAFAEGRITAAARSVARSLPADWPGVRLESVHARYVSELRPALRALALASGFVLLIVTANASVLMLLRTLRRRHELAVRAALGARRADVVRMLAAEVALICAAAFGLALAVTQAALRVLAPIVEERLGRDAPGGTAAFAVDGTVLLAACAACLAIAFCLALLPLRVRGGHGAAPLRSGARAGTDTPALGRARGVLVAAEIAASLALLVGGGLMARTVANLAHTDLGVRTDGIARVRIALPAAEYPDAPSFARFYDPLAATLPHGAFALADFIPFFAPPAESVRLQDGGAERTDGAVLAVSDGYFALFDVAVTRGRGFASSDRAGGEPVAVVSASFARSAWPSGSPLGRRIRVAHDDAAIGWRTVVGVVNDVRQTHADADLRDVYVPFAQTPARFASLYFREDRAPFASYATLRTTIARVDPRVLVTDAVTGMRSLPAEEERQLAGPRFLRSVLAVFAALATLLTALAVYGVTAYAVQQRAHEVAIRMALGASPRAIVSMFLRAAGGIVLAGTLCGLAAAFGVGRLLAHQLHGVAPLDPATLAGACAVTLFAALVATLRPLRLAAAVELRALRGD